MELVPKSSLKFYDGFLLVGQEVYVNDRLAREYNDIVKMADFICFLEQNADEIKAAAQPVVYRPEIEKKPVITSGRTVETPLLDEQMKFEEQRALEFLAKRNAEDVDTMLARLTELAKWFDRDYVLHRTTDIVPVQFKFMDNILELTKEKVVEIVERYHDPEIKKLRNMVDLGV